MVDLLASGAVDRAGGAFGPLRLTGLLFPGDNLVAVTAARLSRPARQRLQHHLHPVRCRHAHRAAAHRGDPVGAGRQQQRAADRRQAHPGARLPAHQRRQRRSTTSRGTLTACHQLAEGLPICDEFLPSVYARAPITIDGASDLATERADPDRSLDFELPADWVRTGSLHLALANLEIDGLPAEMPCDRCDNPNPFGFPGFHQFHNTKPVSFLLVEVKYTAARHHLPAAAHRRAASAVVAAPRLSDQPRHRPRRQPCGSTSSACRSANAVLSRLVLLKLANRALQRPHRLVARQREADRHLLRLRLRRRQVNGTEWHRTSSADWRTTTAGSASDRPASRTAPASAGTPTGPTATGTAVTSSAICTGGVIRASST